MIDIELNGVISNSCLVWPLDGGFESFIWIYTFIGLIKKHKNINFYAY